MPKICSMTGFASAEIEFESVHILWELRSVNHRYLDVSIRLPEDWRALEPQVRKAASVIFSRGKLDCTLRINHTDVNKAEIVVDDEVVKQLAQAIRHISEKLWDAAPVSTLDVLKWPGVVHQQTLASEVFSPKIQALLEQALHTLYQSRLREGEALGETLLRRLSLMRQLLEQAEARIPEVLQYFNKRLQERLQEVAAEMDEQRLAQEMVLLAQKLDVSEEMDRLRTHITEIERILQKGGVMGRRLDFLMQELNREANTTASKSADAALTQLAVEMKVCIEQMREQVQNIE